MDKKSFLRWLETADSAELLQRKSAIVALIEAGIHDRDVRREAVWMVREIELEQLARTEVARASRKD